MYPSQTGREKLALTLSRADTLRIPTMNALRSGSALARRSLATPPAAPLTSSRLLSSFTSSSSKISLSSASLPRTQRLAVASRWSGSTPSLYLTQTRTMASESKIKVKNPVVELDGDEVREQTPPILKLKPLHLGAYHEPAFTSWWPSLNAGKYGVPVAFMCHWPEVGPNTDASAAHPVPNQLTRKLLIDDPNYLARNQRKGKLWNPSDPLPLMWGIPALQAPEVPIAACN